MSQKTIKAARAQIRNAMGSDLERKATDALCLALAGSSAATLEKAQSGVTAGVDVVVEAEPVPMPETTLDSAVKHLRTAAVWTEVRASVQAVLQDAGLASRAGALLHPALLMREVYVKAMRERCLLALKPIHDQMKHDLVERMGVPVDDREPGGRGKPRVEICWLNQTIRTRADQQALATAAEHEQVKSVDVPHGVRGELTSTGEAVGAVAHRAATRRTGGDIVVAVIDGEVTPFHPALRGRVVQRGNFTSEPWGSPSPHGMAVAGIIAAQGADGLTGMAPGAMLYNYKVLPTGEAELVGDFELACALQQALEDGARIANCSVASDTPADGRSRLVRACDNAWALGMTIVKSAGNGGPAKGTITCPGDARGVIVVGATGKDGKTVSRYSSQGPVAGKEFCPDLVAPGGTRGNGKDRRILSCTPDGMFGEIDPGTSLAAPHVAGLLAVILEGRPDLTPDEQRELLLSQCTDPDVDGGGPDVEGKGRISIAALD